MKNFLITFLAVLAAIIVAAIGWGMITAHDENVARARQFQHEQEAAQRLKEIQEQDEREEREHPLGGRSPQSTPQHE